MICNKVNRYPNMYEQRGYIFESNDFLERNRINIIVNGRRSKPFPSIAKRHTKQAELQETSRRRQPGKLNSCSIPFYNHLMTSRAPSTRIRWARITRQTLSPKGNWSKWKGEVSSINALVIVFATAESFTSIIQNENERRRFFSFIQRSDEYQFQTQASKWEGRTTSLYPGRSQFMTRALEY